MISNNFKKNLPIIFANIFILGSLIFYYESNLPKCLSPIESKNQDEYSDLSGNIKNKFHISSITNSKKIHIKYEPIDGKEISWPIKIDFKVYENGNIIKQGGYINIKEGESKTINIERDYSKEYNIITKIYNNNGNLINDSTLKINRQDKTEKKLTLEQIFQKEVEYIKNNINTIVSDFEKLPVNGIWYTVDIKFIKKSDKVAVLEDGNSNINTNALVIFEDGHYSYLVKIKKEKNNYIVEGYYNFIQKPGEKVGWKDIENDEELKIGKIIYNWSIDK